ncbi:hypothetical protein ACLKA7_011835 [Drosophila subpalustris]
MPVSGKSAGPSQMMWFYQLNLNRCEAAQELLTQTVREEKIDVAILSEPYRIKSPNTWAGDKSCGAATWSCSQKPVQMLEKRIEKGFVRAKIDYLYVYSCYFAPSLPLEEYSQILDRLTTESFLPTADGQNCGATLPNTGADGH